MEKTVIIAHENGKWGFHNCPHLLDLTGIFNKGLHRGAANVGPNFHSSDSELSFERWSLWLWPSRLWPKLSTPRGVIDPAATPTANVRWFWGKKNLPRASILAMLKARILRHNNGALVPAIEGKWRGFVGISLVLM
jgi:hypothetical protein